MKVTIFSFLNSLFIALDLLFTFIFCICGILFLIFAFLLYLFPTIPGDYTHSIVCLLLGLTLVIPINLLTIKKTKLKPIKFTKVSIKSIQIIMIFNLIASNLGLSEIDKAKTLVANCTGKEICPGRIEALETLVQSKTPLPGINLSGVDLQGINLINGYFLNKYQDYANFSNTDMSNANLSDATLQGADFNGANLTSANLSDASLNSAYLQGANLSNANFTNTYLRHADLADANLSGANLYNANLAQVENLTASQIKSACNWEKAIYFDGYDEDDKQIMRIKQLKEDKYSDPEKPVYCSRWQQQ